MDHAMAVIVFIYVFIYVFFMSFLCVLCVFYVCVLCVRTQSRVLTSGRAKFYVRDLLS